MDRISVSSETIAEVGYDRETEILEILFRRGTLYQYFNVPAFIYEGLVQSPSLGRYFNAEIRGRFQETKL
jgi:hypothetical protein